MIRFITYIFFFTSFIFSDVIIYENTRTKIGSGGEVIVEEIKLKNIKYLGVTDHKSPFVMYKPIGLFANHKQIKCEDVKEIYIHNVLIDFDCSEKTYSDSNNSEIEKNFKDKSFINFGYTIHNYTSTGIIFDIDDNLYEGIYELNDVKSYYASYSYLSHPVKEMKFSNFFSKLQISTYWLWRWTII